MSTGNCRGAYFFGAAGAWGACGAAGWGAPAGAGAGCACIGCCGAVTGALGAGTEVMIDELVGLLER